MSRKVTHGIGFDLIKENQQQLKFSNVNTLVRHYTGTGNKFVIETVGTVLGWTALSSN